MCSAYETGSKTMSVPVSLWKALECSGNPFTTCWKNTSRSLLSTHSISKRYLGGKRISKTPNGSLICFSTGHLQPHHRLLIVEHLAHIASLEQAKIRLSAEIAERLAPYEEILLRLETILGIKRRIAEILLAEIGAGMSQFPSAAHLASWAGMCPGNHVSAGKRLSGKTRKG